eukprot:15027244-Ditylum_brightwellii.AAC.1
MASLRYGNKSSLNQSTQHLFLAGFKDGFSWAGVSSLSMVLDGWTGTKLSFESIIKSSIVAAQW